MPYPHCCPATSCYTPSNKVNRRIQIDRKKVSSAQSGADSSTTNQKNNASQKSTKQIAAELFPKRALFKKKDFIRKTEREKNRTNTNTKLAEDKIVTEFLDNYPTHRYEEYDVENEKNITNNNSRSDITPNQDKKYRITHSTSTTRKLSSINEIPDQNISSSNTYNINEIITHRKPNPYQKQEFESRPQYLKFFKLLKKSARNRTLNQDPKLNKILPKNLNTDQKITLSMISRAIEKGLDSLEQPNNNTNNNRNEPEDKIKFIYIGVSPTPIKVRNSNVVFYDSDGNRIDPGKQNERPRRNTRSKAYQPLIVNESRGKPVFYLPQTEPRIIANNEKNTSTANVEVADQNNHNEKKLVDNNNGKTTNKTSHSNRSRSRLLTDRKEILEKEKIQNRSQSRMTVPLLRQTNLATNNNNTTNNRRNKFDATKYEQYRNRFKQRNKKTITKPDDGNSQVSPAPQVLQARKAPDSTTSTKVKLKPNLKTEETRLERSKSMKKLRQRLLQRRRGPPRKAVIHTNSNNNNGSALLEKELSDDSTTLPPDILKGVQKGCSRTHNRSHYSYRKKKS